MNHYVVRSRFNEPLITVSDSIKCEWDLPPCDFRCQPHDKDTMRAVNSSTIYSLNQGVTDSVTWPLTLLEDAKTKVNYKKIMLVTKKNFNSTTNQVIERLII